MNTESREHLSSFMDGEISQESARFLVRRLSADAGLRETWARYHLIRDCLRQQDGDLVTHNLGKRVQIALADAPAVFADRRRGGWLRSAVGAAIAASVALFAVLIIVPDSGPIPWTGGEAPNPQAAVAEPFVSPNIRGPVPNSQPANLSGSEANDGREFNAYLLRHYQVTGGSGGRGFVSFVPIVVTQGSAVREGESAPADETRDEVSTIQ